MCKFPQPIVQTEGQPHGRYVDLIQVKSATCKVRVGRVILSVQFELKNSSLHISYKDIHHQSDLHLKNSSS